MGVLYQARKAMSFFFIAYLLLFRVGFLTNFSQYIKPILGFCPLSVGLCPGDVMCDTGCFSCIELTLHS